MSGHTSRQLAVKKAAVSERRGNATFRRLVLGASGVSLVLLVACLLANPGLLLSLPLVLACIALLLLYLALGIRGPRAVDCDGYLALRRGLLYGRVLGGVWVIAFLFSNPYSLDDRARLTVALVVYLVVFGSTIMAGLFSARETGRLRSGVETGLWIGVISSSVAVCGLLLALFLFADSLRENPAIDAAFIQSRVASFSVFLLAYVLRLSLLHLFWFGLALGPGLGALGGLAGRALAKDRLIVAG